jgi:hypothetical protein
MLTPSVATVQPEEREHAGQPGHAGHVGLAKWLHALQSEPSYAIESSDDKVGGCIACASGVLKAEQHAWDAEQAQKTMYGQMYPIVYADVRDEVTADVRRELDTECRPLVTRALTSLEAEIRRLASVATNPTRFARMIEFPMRLDTLVTDWAAFITAWGVDDSSLAFADRCIGAEDMFVARAEIDIVADDRRVSFRRPTIRLMLQRLLYATLGGVKPPTANAFFHAAHDAAEAVQHLHGVMDRAARLECALSLTSATMQDMPEEDYVEALGLLQSGLVSRDARARSAWNLDSDNDNGNDHPNDMDAMSAPTDPTRPFYASDSESEVDFEDAYSIDTERGPSKYTVDTDMESAPIHPVRPYNGVVPVEWDDLMNWNE